MKTKIILGVKFFSGTPAEAVEQGLYGGLVVVPSAPVLVGIENDTALRAGVLGADLAITDSGFMVLLWWLLKWEKLERVSGLEYLKLLLERLRTQQLQLLDEGYSISGDRRPGAGKLSDKSYELLGHRPGAVVIGDGLSVIGEVHPKHESSTPITYNQQPITKNAGGVFWVMPTAAARDRNLAWLQSQGHPPTIEDCYVAPVYPVDGDLSDGRLLEIILTRQPAHIIIALGGGVQERLGWFLRQELEKARSVEQRAKGQIPDDRSQTSGNEPLPLTASPSAAASLPGIHCIGAAIGFLSGEQVNIPPWADYFYLGWLFRSLSEPAKFVPRYWKAKRLVWLMIRYGEKAPIAENLKAET